MNAIFGLEVRITLSDRVIVGLATGTAVYLPALPPPALPKILSSSNIVTDKTHLARVHQKLKDKVESNLEYFGLPFPSDISIPSGIDLQDDGTEMDLSAGNKDTCVLEGDDTEDADIVDSLLDLHPPAGFQVISLDTPVGVDTSQTIGHCQAFTQIWRGKLPCRARDLSTSMQNLVSAVCFKLRRFKPCLLCSLKWDVSVDEESEVQLCLSGLALSLASQEQIQKTSLMQAKRMRDLVKEESELMFRLDGVGKLNGASQESSEDSVPRQMSDKDLQIKSEKDLQSKENDAKDGTKVSGEKHPFMLPGMKNKFNSLVRRKMTATGLLADRLPPYFFSAKNTKFGVNVTPMAFIPGARIE